MFRLFACFRHATNILMFPTRSESMHGRAGNGRMVNDAGALAAACSRREPAALRVLFLDQDLSANRRSQVTPRATSSRLPTSLEAFLLLSPIPAPNKSARTPTIPLTPNVARPWQRHRQ
jgi:hypothetical protein